MALFGKKKEEETGRDGDAAAVEVHSADKQAMAFTPQPEKARKFFDHARTVADTGHYEYATFLFATGLRFDPEDMAAHREMYEAAIRLHNKGPKAASRKELTKLDGPTPVERFAAAEFGWMRSLTSASHAMKLLQAAAKADQSEFGRWFAPKLLNVLAKQKKPSKSDFLAAMSLLREVGAWDEALKAGAKAYELDPTDSNLSAQLKNISAQRAMEQGGYGDTAGVEGGFRKFVRDEERQRELEEDQSFSGSGGADERALQRAKAKYEESPQTPDVIRKYVSLLKRAGRPDDIEQAKRVCLKAYADTKEYHFKVAAGDITIRQGEQRVLELEEKVKANPDDAELREELDSARRELMMYKASEYEERGAKYPSDRTIRYHLGLIQFELGNFDAAMGAFQQSKDEPKLRVASGHLLGLCFARVGWHREAVGEFKEALEAIDATTRDRELDVRYDLMVSLIEHARSEKSLDLAKEALEICSSIARKDITYRDIRVKRKEVDELITEVSA